MSEWLCPQCSAPTRELVRELPNGTVIRGLAEICQDCDAEILAAIARENEEIAQAIVEIAALKAAFHAARSDECHDECLDCLEATFSS